MIALTLMGNGVNGEKKAMIAHIVGKTPCPHASKEAQRIAKQEKEGLKQKKRDRVTSDEEGGDEDGSKRQRSNANTWTPAPTLQQSKLKPVKGIDMPFPESDIPTIQQQFLRATISANLPFAWTTNIEVVKLFSMFRSRAEDVIPDRQVVAGRLLNEASLAVDETMKQRLKGQNVTISYVSSISMVETQLTPWNSSSDGWKDCSKDSITGVNASAKGKAYLIDVFKSTGDPKDGESMATAFGKMIGQAEEKYDCRAVTFCCDNDGGSQKGRKLLGTHRPHLFVPPCMAHQVQSAPSVTGLG